MQVAGPMCKGFGPACWGAGGPSDICIRGTRKQGSGPCLHQKKGIGIRGPRRWSFDRSGVGGARGQRAIATPQPHASIAVRHSRLAQPGRETPDGLTGGEWAGRPLGERKVLNIGRTVNSKRRAAKQTRGGGTPPQLLVVFSVGDAGDGTFGGGREKIRGGGGSRAALPKARGCRLSTGQNDLRHPPKCPQPGGKKLGRCS